MPIRLFWLSFVLLFVSSGSGHLAAKSIEVRNVDYASVSYDSSESWYELAIELEAFRDSEDEARRDSSFLDDVTMELLLGVEIRSGKRAGEFEFFKATVELVSMESGRNWIRFYLPPEIVERDRLRSRPHSYLLRFTRGTTFLSQTWSPSLERESVRNNFVKRVFESGAVNDGILQPQQETPFSDHYSKSTISIKSRNR